MSRTGNSENIVITIESVINMTVCPLHHGGKNWFKKYLQALK